MDESDILLRDILDAPGDDLLRRIYADWMVDHGDSARAEFIHLQILLVEMGPDDERRPEAEARQRRLQKANERRWLGKLRPHVFLWRFKRGFVHHLGLRGSALLEQHALIAQSVPLDSLELAQVQERGILDRIATLPLISRLHALDLSGNALDAADAESLLGSPNVEGLCELRFNDNPYGFDAVNAVVESRTLGSLEVLEMRRNNLTDSTAARLCDSACLSGLRVLDLRGNSIGEGGRREVRRFFGDAARF